MIITIFKISFKTQMWPLQPNKSIEISFYKCFKKKIPMRSK